MVQKSDLFRNALSYPNEEGKWPFRVIGEENGGDNNTLDD